MQLTRLTSKCILRLAAWVFGACLPLLGWGGQDPANAQMDAGSNRMLRSRDVEFATEAAQDGIAEIELGQLAIQKASNPDVKEFGRQMVSDHSRANDKLKAIAGRQGITLPTVVAGRDQATQTNLQRISGAKFDHVYMKAVVKDHREDVKQFRKEIKTGKDASIKDFASETLPILQAHLEKAKAVAASAAGR